MTESETFTEIRFDARFFVGEVESSESINFELEVLNCSDFREDFRLERRSEDREEVLSFFGDSIVAASAANAFAIDEEVYCSDLRADRFERRSEDRADLAASFLGESGDFKGLVDSNGR